MNALKVTAVMLLLASFVSHSAGQNVWQTVPSPTGNNLNAVYVLDSLHIFMCGDNGVVFRSDDAGQTWINIFPPGSSGNLHDIYFWHPDSGIVVGDNGQIFRTVSGGQFWQRISTGVTDHLFCVAFSQSAGICGASSQTILRTADAGQSWQIVQSGFFGGGFWGAEMLSPEIGFIGGENSIFQPLVGATADSGATWTWTAFYLNSNEGRIFDIAFIDQNIGHAASRVWDGRGALSKTIDGGQTWTTTLFSQALYGIYFPTSNAGQIGYACGEGGQIFYTDDGGITWQSQSSGTSAKLNDLGFYGPYSGYAVGDGGVLLRSIPSPTAISSNDDPVAGESYLSQNYPNPFNPSTNVDFGLGISEWVHLSVYDLAGRKIKTLLNEKMARGRHRVSWDGRDKNGRLVAGGIYVYRLRAGKFVQSRKMLLVR